MSLLSLFRRDPVKKLREEHRRLLGLARDLQRNGDIQSFARMTARAAEIAEEIEKREAKQG